MTAGPNGRKSVWAAPLDALAFMLHPSQFVALSTFCLFTGQVYIPLWVLSIGCLMLPISGLIRAYEWCFSVSLVNWTGLAGMYLGKLTALPEGGGKVRIVASADFWTQ